MQVAFPHVITPGVAASPPSGAEHEPPPAFSGPVLLLEALELDVPVDANVEELSVLELKVELETLFVDADLDVPTVLDPVPLPGGSVPHVVAEPNAVVRPHASGRHSGEALCALPMHVRRSWKLAALPFAVAVTWSASHVSEQDVYIAADEGLVVCTFACWPGSPTSVQSLTHVAASCPHPSATTQNDTEARATRSRRMRESERIASSWSTLTSAESSRSAKRSLSSPTMARAFVFSRFSPGRLETSPVSPVSAIWTAPADRSTPPRPLQSSCQPESKFHSLEFDYSELGGGRPLLPCAYPEPDARLRVRRGSRGRPTASRLLSFRHRPRRPRARRRH